MDEMKEREVALLMIAVGEGRMPVEQAFPLACEMCSTAIPIQGASLTVRDFEEIDGELTMIVREELILWGECPTCGETVERNWGPVYDKLGSMERFEFTAIIEEAAKNREHLVRPSEGPTTLLRVPAGSPDSLVTPADPPDLHATPKWRILRLFRARRRESIDT